MQNTEVTNCLLKLHDTPKLHVPTRTFPYTLNLHGVMKVYIFFS